MSNPIQRAQDRSSRSMSHFSSSSVSPLFSPLEIDDAAGLVYHRANNLYPRIWTCEVTAPCAVVLVLVLVDLLSFSLAFTVSCPRFAMLSILHLNACCLLLALSREFGIAVPCVPSVHSRLPGQPS